MKKALCLLLAGVTAFSLSACGMPEFDSSNLTEAQAYTYAIFEKETPAPWAVCVTRVVTALTKRKLVRAGVVILPKPITAVATDDRFSLKAIRAEHLAVELNQFVRRKGFVADGTVCIIFHGVLPPKNKNSPERVLRASWR